MTPLPVWCATPVRVLALLTLAAVAACSSAPEKRPGQKPTVPVTGQVFVNDKPAAGAFVLFVPVNEPPGSSDPRPRAECREDGTFAVSTYGEEDGAPPGEYLVGVRWLVNGRDDEDRLNGRFADPTKSRIKVTVQSGPTTLPPLKLK